MKVRVQVIIETEAGEPAAVHEIVCIIVFPTKIPVVG
jgi:hypothetical protein